MEENFCHGQNVISELAKYSEVKDEVGEATQGNPSSVDRSVEPASLSDAWIQESLIGIKEHVQRIYSFV